MTLLMPTPEAELIIKQQINEDDKTRDASLQTIKDWLAKQPHLPDTWDDASIMCFLRGCKFSLEKTKRKIDKYFTMRAAAPEIFTNRDVRRPEIQEIIKQITVPPLPKMTADGKRVIVYRIKNNPELNLFHETIVKVNLMIGDIRVMEEKVGFCGDVYILDTHGMGPLHLARVNPTLCQKFLICAQEAYPQQPKEIHIINAHPFVSVVFSWFKPFLTEKMRNRIHIHTGSLDSLYKFVSKEYLPEEYGGTGGNLQLLHDEWMQKLEQYTPWFQEQEHIKADESKRPGKPYNYDELFCVDGSFKQLAID